MAQHNVTVTFTAEQARILLCMIGNDTEELKRSGDDVRNIINQNKRIEDKLIKAMMKANGMAGF